MNAEQQNELIPMKLGESLRLERERQKLPLERVAAEIRVRPAVLAAIEADDFRHIPRVYLKGYVRSYARRLGLKPDDVDVRIGDCAGDEPRVQSVFSEALPRDRSERWFKASSYVLASAVVIALVWQFTTEAVRFSQGDALPRGAATDASRQAAPGTSVTDAGAPLTDAYEPDVPESAGSHLRASIASVETTRPPQQIERRSVAEGAWAAVGNRAGDAIPAGETGQNATALTIATSADSWVEIVDGTGARIEMDLLRAGTRRNYGGVEPFRLLLGRASSIQLSYQGQPVDLAPHTRGNVARVTLGGAQDAPQDVVPEQPPESATAPANGEGSSEQG